MRRDRAHLRAWPTRPAALLLLALAAPMFVLACDSTERDWKKATNDNSELAYQAFLKSHASSVRAEEAATRLEQLAWDRTVRAATKGAWRAFISQYPKGKHRPEAEQQLEDLDWRDAETENTTAAFEAFIGAHPASTRLGLARTRLDTAKALDTTRAMVAAVRDELRRQSGGATVALKFLPALVSSTDGSRLKFEVPFRVGELYTSEFVTNRVAFNRVLYEAPPGQMFGISDDMMFTLPRGWSATFDSERLRSQVSSAGLKVGEPVTVVILAVSRAGVLCGVHPRTVLPPESVRSWQESLAMK